MVADVKSPSFTFHILLVCQKSGHETEIANAWQQDGDSSGDPYPCTIVCYFLERDHDPLVVVDLLDRIRAGIFHAVFIFPDASTWSRARNLGDSLRRPWRSREHPLGLPELPPAVQTQLNHQNLSLEIALYFSQQALQCPQAQVAWLLAFPEDFGGDSRSGPASLWGAQEFRSLEGLNDARRSAGYLCQLSAAEYRRPIGFLSNVPNWSKHLFYGWPQFSTVGGKLLYEGPLPRNCSCQSQHAPMVGACGQEDSQSPSQIFLGQQFWHRIFLAYDNPMNRAPLRMGLLQMSSVHSHYCNAQVLGQTSIQAGQLANSRGRFYATTTWTSLRTAFSPPPFLLTLVRRRGPTSPLAALSYGLLRRGPPQRVIRHLWRGLQYWQLRRALPLRGLFQALRGRERPDVWRNPWLPRSRGE